MLSRNKSSEEITVHPPQQTRKVFLNANSMNSRTAERKGPLDSTRLDIVMLLTLDHGMRSRLSLMPPKRMSTSEEPAITQAAIRKLIADSVTATLEAQAANMENTDNTTRLREAPVAR
ncbi:hypothetical protein Tco_1077172 [Tanacetum coccineum]